MADNINVHYQKDKENIESFLNHKTPTFNFASFKRLCLSELCYNSSFKNNMIFGLTRKQIINIVQYPERYSLQIIRLSRYMMQKSGYYKRLIDYFSNMAIINWTIDTEIKKYGLLSANQDTFKKNYIKYTAQVNKFKLDNRVTDIFRKLFVEDVCFGFVSENNIEAPIFILDPHYCTIERLTNGSVYQFSINRSLIKSDIYDALPQELQCIIEQSKEISKDNRIMIPRKNSFCIKYNNDFTYLYPPFFNLIGKILEIDDYRDLMKAKTESDAYKIIYLKIPTNDDNQIAMGNEIITPFTEIVKEIVPETYGVIPSPMDLELVESKSTASDDSNKVADAVDNYYGEAGVSKALISSASSGSELKLSMKVDSSDMYRIYRQIEAWVDLQMKLRGYIYNDYQFVYKIIPVTTFDIEDFSNRMLKLSQASLPIKMELAAVNGVNPAKLLGNSITEQMFQEDILDKWQPLRSSYTESNDRGDEGGRPMMDETEISKTTDVQRSNDSNKTENRI